MRLRDRPVRPDIARAGRRAWALLHVLDDPASMWPHDAASAVSRGVGVPSSWARPAPRRSTSAAPRHRRRVAIDSCGRHDHRRICAPTARRPAMRRAAGQWCRSASAFPPWKNRLRPCARATACTIVGTPTRLRSRPAGIVRKSAGDQSSPASRALRIASARAARRASSLSLSLISMPRATGW